MCSAVFIGFGEAALAFAEDMAGPLRAFDRKVCAPDTKDAKLADLHRSGVLAAASNAEAVRGVSLILSLVTADQAVPAAVETASHIMPGAISAT